MIFFYDFFYFYAPVLPFIIFRLVPRPSFSLDVLLLLFLLLLLSFFLFSSRTWEMGG